MNGREALSFPRFHRTGRWVLANSIQLMQTVNLQPTNIREDGGRQRGREVGTVLYREKIGAPAY